MSRVLRNIFPGLAIALCGLLVIPLLWFVIAQPLKVLPRMRPVPPFMLVLANGRWLGAADLKGQATVLSFGSSRCGTPCARSEALVQELARSKQALRLVTISIDPEHDTPAVLSTVQQEAEGRQWLTGRVDEIKQVVGGGFGVYYAPIADGGLTVDERVVLIDGNGLVRAEYEGAQIDVQRVLRDLRLLEEEAASTGLWRSAYEASHLFLCYAE
jgi:protein SCO1